VTALKKKVILALSGLLIFAAAFLIYFFGSEYIRNYLYKLRLPDFPEPQAGSRVLIIAPHCDDETLGPGEFISRFNKKGVNFKVVLMTNGDGFTDAVDIAFRRIQPRVEDYIKFGYLRQNETRNAMEHFGLKDEDIIFLGYPDGGLYSMWSQEHWSTPYESKHTKQSKSPYYNSYSPGVSYTGENVSKDLIRIIESYKPDYIFYPHPNDRHPDHLASYCFAKYVINQLGLKTNEYVYLVHRGDWPVIAKGESKLFLVPPPALMDSGSNWMGFNLSGAETQEKRESINRYKSQVRVMGPRLVTFARRNELFAGYSDGVIGITDTNPDFRNYLMVKDPTSDVFLSAIKGGGDLRALYGYGDTKGNFKFFLETRKGIKSDIKYSFNIIFYNLGMEMGRIAVDARDGKNSFYFMRYGGRTAVNDIALSIKKNILEIDIPQGYGAGCDRAFIGASSSTYGIRLDNMAWRMYDIQKAPY
jgi:Uncharacterized proteins, LmbE homologs